MNGDAGDGDDVARDVPAAEGDGGLFGGGEVVIGRVVGPEAVGVEVGDDGKLRDGLVAAGAAEPLLFPAEAGDDLGGEEVGVDDDVPAETVVLFFENGREFGE